MRTSHDVFFESVSADVGVCCYECVLRRHLERRLSGGRGSESADLGGAIGYLRRWVLFLREDIGG